MKMVRNRAFTMIELVFVIVIVGILASLAIPRLERNGAKEAAEQILSHIRYTQHLALQDDKFKLGDDKWFRKRWNIAFAQTTIRDCSIDKSGPTWKYSVFFDKTLSGNLNSKDEVAADPQKPRMFLSAGWSGISGVDCKRVNKDLNIQKRFGVTSVNFSGNCATGGVRTISFDEIGRPMRVVSTTGGGSMRAYDRLFKNECIIALRDNSGHTASIAIQPRTGFAYIK